MRFLEDHIRELNLAYYAGEPLISDAEFDLLWRELEGLEAEHPELAAPDSPTGEVDDGFNPLFTKVDHVSPMLSLNKAYHPDEVAKWAAEYPGQSFVLQPKFDGVSLSLTYRAGRLVRALTRGNGRRGDDVSVNIVGLTPAGIPHRLPQSLDCEVRGELLMSKSDFLAFNASRPEDPLRNPRNGAAGTIRAKTLSKVIDRRLTFYAFDLIEEGVHQRLDQRLSELGFSMGESKLVSAEELWEEVERMVATRMSRDYEMDGVVIRVADRRVYQAAGATGHHPLAALAYKTGGEEAEAEIAELVANVGRTGKLTLRWRFQQPVSVGGTDVTFAAAHNETDILEKDIRVGDTVIVTRAGDVIPHVLRALAERRDGSECACQPITHCPSCGTELLIEGDREMKRCPNVASCPKQAVRRLIFWASKSAADLEVWGEKWITTAYEAGVLKSPADFYRLQPEQLMGFERMGETLAAKLAGVGRSGLQLGMRRALIGLGIPLASEGTAKRLCWAGYASVEEVAQASVEELQAIRDIGERVAANLHAALRQPAVLAELAELRALGVSLDCLPEDKRKSGSLDGKTVCLTGTLSGMKRAAFGKLLEAQGAQVSSSVSAKTDYLLAGADAGSKLAKAEKLGVPVVDENTARGWVGLPPL